MLNRKTLLSWEFISFVLVSAGAWLLDWAGQIGGTTAVYLAAAAAGVTAISRGLAKKDADLKNWWETTEFYVALIGGAQACLADLGGTPISTQTLTFIGTGLTFALAIARGIGKNNLVAAGLLTPEQAALSGPPVSVNASSSTASAVVEKPAVTKAKPKADK